MPHQPGPQSRDWDDDELLPDDEPVDLDYEADEEFWDELEDLRWPEARSDDDRWRDA